MSLLNISNSCQQMQKTKVVLITMATFVAATHCNATRLKLDRHICGALDQQRYRQVSAKLV